MIMGSSFMDGRSFLDELLGVLLRPWVGTVPPAWGSLGGVDVMVESSGEMMLGVVVVVVVVVVFVVVVVVALPCINCVRMTGENCAAITE